MIYGGIDVGLNGGIVLLDENQNIINKFIMPILKVKGKSMYDIKNIINIFKSNKIDYVYLEKMHPRPISGVKASFNLGYGYGIMQSILELLKISYELVNPQTWMKEFGIDSKNEKGSILYCQRKWSNEKWTATDRCSKCHDGLTDSAVIALYCYRKNRGTQ
jgi:hypothetical protein